MPLSAATWLDKFPLKSPNGPHLLTLGGVKGKMAEVGSFSYSGLIFFDEMGFGE